MNRFAAVGSALVAGALLAPAASAGPEALVLQVSDATVYEGNAGTTLASFQVRRIGSFTGKAQTVSFTTADGDAVAGSDYVATAGTLTFDKKTEVHTVVVEVNGDAAQEPDEFFLLLVSNTGGGDPEGRGRILNDDGWPPS
jgi:hypothetical protein